MKINALCARTHTHTAGERIENSVCRLDDNELESVSGGMRVAGGTESVKICPVCGNHDTVVLSDNKACRLCRVRGCGTIFGAMDGKVVGVEPTIANQKP